MISNRIIPWLSFDITIFSTFIHQWMNSLYNNNYFYSYSFFLYLSIYISFIHVMIFIQYKLNVILFIRMKIRMNSFYWISFNSHNTYWINNLDIIHNKILWLNIIEIHIHQIISIHYSLIKILINMILHWWIHLDSHIFIITEIGFIIFSIYSMNSSIHQIISFNDEFYFLLYLVWICMILLYSCESPTFIYSMLRSFILFFLFLSFFYEWNSFYIFYSFLMNSYLYIMKWFQIILWITKFYIILIFYYFYF